MHLMTVILVIIVVMIATQCIFKLNYNGVTRGNDGVKLIFREEYI